MWRFVLCDCARARVASRRDFDFEVIPRGGSAGKAEACLIPPSAGVYVICGSFVNNFYCAFCNIKVRRDLKTVSSFTKLFEHLRIIKVFIIITLRYFTVIVTHLKNLDVLIGLS